MHRSARILLLASLTLATPVHAQNLYRCGKVFQDRPCDAATPGKVISSSTPASSQSTSPAANPECARRGERAKRIVWARETGKTQDDQLAATTSTDEQTLIREVYLMRGSSNQIGAAVETKCVADRERAAQAAAAVIALQKEDKTQVPAATAQATAGLQTTSPPPATDAEQAAATARKRRCDDHDARLRGIQEQERAGGSASVMDSLRKQRRDLDARRQADGC